MIPERYANIVFILLLTGLMSLIVSGISSLRAVGPGGFGVAIWLTAWGASWAVAFPAALLVTPLTRALVEKIVRPERHRTGRR